MTGSWIIPPCSRIYGILAGGAVLTHGTGTWGLTVSGEYSFMSFGTKGILRWGWAKPSARWRWDISPSNLDRKIGLCFMSVLPFGLQLTDLNIYQSVLQSQFPACRVIVTEEELYFARGSIVCGMPWRSSSRRIPQDHRVGASWFFKNPETFQSSMYSLVLLFILHHSPSIFFF